MAKRLNDTAAVAAQHPAVTDTEMNYESVSVSSRKISNGYVVCKSGPDGQYREEYHEERPQLVLEESHTANPAGSGAMSRATSFLNK